MNDKVTITQQVTIHYTAEDWELYADMTGANTAAEVLSSVASEALSMSNAIDAWDHWNKASNTFMRWGAADSEPRFQFHRLVVRVFGSDPTW
jgi:spore coat protein CotH